MIDISFNLEWSISVHCTSHQHCFCRRIMARSHQILTIKNNTHSTYKRTCGVSNEYFMSSAQFATHIAMLPDFAPSRFRKTGAEAVAQVWKRKFSSVFQILSCKIFQNFKTLSCFRFSGMGYVITVLHN